MRLWAVQFKSECYRDTIPLVEHEIIVDADTPGEAQRRAREWFRSENPCTTPPSEPIMRDDVELE